MSERNVSSEPALPTSPAPSPGHDRTLSWRMLLLVLLLIALSVGATGRFPKHGDHFGIWSIVPPLLAIVLAFWLRDVITALLLGIVAGGIIAGQFNIVQAYMLPSIGSPTFAQILLVYLWALGGLIGLWTRTGGATVFSDWASEKMVVGPRSAKLFAWVMGLIFHQGGTISTVLTGATVRSIGDRHRVSHEELSYVVDSTASPVAALIPFNIWPIYVGATVGGTIPLIANNTAGVVFFFQAIPFNFYAMFAILLTLLLSLDLLPYPGRRMRAAIVRARTTGKLDRDGAAPLAARELSDVRVVEGYRPGLIDFFGPMGTLLGVAIIPYVFTYFILGRTDAPMLLIAEAFVLAVVVAILIALVKGMPLREAMNGFIDGCKGVTIGALILALAVTLKSVAEAVGTAPYLVETLRPVIVPGVLPAVFMALCMITAFSTGTSFGTYAVVFPIAMPLAYAIQPDPLFITLCFAAVTGGSLFGDQCSPISDTTILASLSTGCDLMDHVYTQLPLALLAAGAAMLLYTVIAFAIT